MDFTWKNEYDIGIVEIDKQHKEMFLIMAELNDAINSNKPKEILDGILSSLLESTKNHFSYEEDTLERLNYVNLEEHTRLHDIFERRVEKLIDTFEHGKDLSTHLADFLEEWLIHHIGDEDRKFVGFLHENNVY